MEHSDPFIAQNEQQESKYAAWLEFLEEHKDDYPNIDEKSRRSRLSIDYQLTKFYDKFEATSVSFLTNNFAWREYVAAYYYHKTLAKTYSQERLLIIAKAFFTAQGLKFDLKYKSNQPDLPKEFDSLIPK